MDVIGGLIARLDGPAPLWADRLTWRRARRSDAARRVIDALVKRGDVAVDVGASRGVFSARLHDLVGPRGAVHAFEPNPEHQGRLHKLARDGRIVVHAVALSDRDGEATLHIPLIEGRAVAGCASLEPRWADSASAVTVPVLRLDDALGPDERVGFIKCDAEGHEDAVMEGAREVLARSGPGVLVEIEQRHRSAELTRAFDWFAALGYEGWAVFPGGLRPLAAFDLDRDQFAFLGGEPAGEMPRGYVNDFLFVLPGRNLSALLDPTARR
jgi:FkbM family methyltransferase